MDPTCPRCQELREQFERAGARQGQILTEITQHEAQHQRPRPRKPPAPPETDTATE